MIQVLFKSFSIFIIWMRLQKVFKPISLLKFSLSKCVKCVANCNEFNIWFYN